MTAKENNERVLEMQDEAVYTAEERAKGHRLLAALIILGMYSAGALAGIIWLSATERTVPESLISTLSLSMGAIAGMAATSGS